MLNANVFNLDFQDFIKIANQTDLEYILVGGFATILNGYNRTTGDMDIWVNRTPNNFRTLIRVFALFGLPTLAISEHNFLNNNALDVFTFGRPPVAIDIMNKVKGLEFEAAFANSKWYEFEDFKVRYLALNDLITAKRAAGRAKDIDDIAHLA